MTKEVTFSIPAEHNDLSYHVIAGAKHVQGTTAGEALDALGGDCLHGHSTSCIYRHFSLRQMALMVLTVFWIFWTSPPAGLAASSGCPLPTVAHGGQCILTQDTALDRTLTLASSTHLNCRGWKLMPAQSGVVDDPATSADEGTYGSPMVAILLDGVDRVKIQNCTFEGFDWGIWAMSSKHHQNPGDGHKILSNTFHIRYAAMTLHDVDDAVIDDNDITGTSSGELLILILRDSDRNVVSNNRLVSNPKSSTFDPGPNNVFGAPNPNARTRPAPPPTTFLVSSSPPRAVSLP
jgi:hypothetical protein